MLSELARAIGDRSIHPTVARMEDGGFRVESGMTVRMEFAKAAMQGMMANGYMWQGLDENKIKPSDGKFIIAREAFGQADEMLEFVAKEEPNNDE